MSVFQFLFSILCILGYSWHTGGRERPLIPTLYPEALTFRPLLVRVDFMRTKKDRSWTRKAGDASVGLASEAEQEGTVIEFSRILSTQNQPQWPLETLRCI